MANEVFNRYEKKYMLDESTMRSLQQRMPDLRPDKHCSNDDTYSICSLYYDTHDDLLIRRSLEKPAYREKLRLRAYGVPRLDSSAFVEIKKKAWKQGNKRRSAMKLGEAYAFLESGRTALQPYMNGQVLREVGYMMHRYTLEPRMYISYDRRAYHSASRPDLRITFDTNIRTRRYDLRLEAGRYGQPLLPEGEWLMEIKVADSMPVWLVRLLAEYKLYPTSFSKYGTEYRQYLDRRGAAAAATLGNGGHAGEAYGLGRLAAGIAAYSMPYGEERAAAGSVGGA